MAERTWFYAADGKQLGPNSDAQLRGLIARGVVRADTLVWSEGMSGWQNAGEIPGLIPAGSAPPAVAGAMMAGGAAPGGQTTADISTFGLFGRALLLAIGLALVIPAPWVATMWYRWIVERLRVPQRPNIGFTGNPGDIWYVFVILGLCTWAGFAGIDYLSLILLPIQAFLYWVTIRWVVANISSDGRPLGLTFQGSVWGYLGWYLFSLVSAITIIGWAWVLTAWLRWMCRNVAGTRRAVVFNGSGWGVLWRTVVFVLACIPLIPIPWVLAWITRWYLSQFAVVERTAEASPAAG